MQVNEGALFQEQAIQQLRTKFARADWRWSYDIQGERVLVPCRIYDPDIHQGKLLYLEHLIRAEGYGE